jgi:MAE_28990/MAE_18760-like HEPN
MNTAKNNFILGMDNFESIVSPKNTDDEILVTKAFTEIIHNKKVKMLRNGMAIIGYTLLEDFIKKRAGEVLKEIGRTSVNFNSLPPKLKEATTVGALKGIQIRAELLKRDNKDHISFIQNETSYISSTKDSVFEMSEYSLGWDKSNLSSTDITNFLSIFNVNKGWEAIRLISSSISITLTDPCEIFKNAASRRHKAAHNTDADSLLSDLINFNSQSRVIAFAFDSLISQSLKHIKNNNINFLNENSKTEERELSFRFLTEVDNNWKEFKQNSSKAYRVKNSLSELRIDAEIRARRNDEVLVIKSENNNIVNWII